MNHTDHDSANGPPDDGPPASKRLKKDGSENADASSPTSTALPSQPSTPLASTQQPQQESLNTDEAPRSREQQSQQLVTATALHHVPIQQGILSAQAANVEAVHPSAPLALASTVSVSNHSSSNVGVMHQPSVVMSQPMILAPVFPPSLPLSITAQHQQTVHQLSRGYPVPSASPALPIPSHPLIATTILPGVTPCDICCEKTSAVFVCAGGCGLRVHPGCIGETNFFSSILGQVCGSCFLMQQNRISKEDVRKGGMNGISVRRAILCLNVETTTGFNFEKFGHLASLRLHEIGCIAGYPIKPFAEKFVEPYLQRWVREKLSLASTQMLGVREIFTLMIGLYSLQKSCIAHGLKNELIDAIQKRSFSVTDYLGWHPAIDEPQVRCSNLCAVCGIRNAPELDVCAQCHRPLAFPSIFTKFVSALLATFYGEHIGVSVGVTSGDVFSHLQSVRACYRGLKPFDVDGFDWEMFADQMRMIFGLLDVVSDFGVLQLSSELFEPEVKIIFNAVYINQAMLNTDYEIVGKFLQCMRLFGQHKCAENSNLISLCEHFLVRQQNPNGSWCKLDGTVVDRYKATVSCAKALLPPSFQGYGPVSSDFQRLLEQWALNTPLGSKKPKEYRLLSCGARVKVTSRATFKKLEKLYKRQLIGDSGDNPLEMQVASRLRAIYQEQKNEGDPSEHQPNSSGERQDDTSDAVTHVPTPNKEALPETTNQEDETLTSLSLNGELEIFDGLKFEDGDVIDVTQQLNQRDPEENDEEANGDDVPEADDGIEDVYDDDDDDSEGNKPNETIPTENQDSSLTNDLDQANEVIA